MIQNLLKQNNSDLIGAMASSLCLVHCLATPFLFIAQSGAATCKEGTPIWWQGIDYLFIAVSFFAVYWSVKNSSKAWVKNVLWVSWFALAVLILNESFHFVHLPEVLIYIPALALVSLHIYNRKYCQCDTDNNCCALSEKFKEL